VDGRWEVRINLGRGLDGKCRTKSAFAPTQAEAVKTFKRLNGRAMDGQVLATSTPTVKSFLADWFATNRDAWRPSTRRSYKAAIDLYLEPAFGKRPSRTVDAIRCSEMADRSQRKIWREATDYPFTPPLLLLIDRAVRHANLSE
jgi:hypothetical protein